MHFLMCLESQFMYQGKVKFSSCRKNLEAHLKSLAGISMTWRGASYDLGNNFISFLVVPYKKC